MFNFVSFYLHMWWWMLDGILYSVLCRHSINPAICIATTHTNALECSWMFLVVAVSGTTLWVGRRRHSQPKSSANRQVIRLVEDRTETTSDAAALSHQTNCNLPSRYSLHLRQSAGTGRTGPDHPLKHRIYSVHVDFLADSFPLISSSCTALHCIAYCVHIYESSTNTMSDKRTLK